MSQDAPLASSGLRYVQYHSSNESVYLKAIRQLISQDLSEPYSIYVYRYFLYQWGHLCFMVGYSESHYLTLVLTTCRRWMIRTTLLEW